MPGPAKVIIVEADPAANAALRFGLSRAGLEVATASDPVDVATEAGSAGLVLISNSSSDDEAGNAAKAGTRSDGAPRQDSAELVRSIRTELDEAALLTPILFLGGAGEREDKKGRLAVERAGAAEVLQGPQSLRDIANVARIMLGDRRSEGWAGTLAEISGVFGLVRALAALGRSGVLTLTRGVRRGEVRYYHGEITSAQVGMIHGQAAFHQLLLWIDAKFDFRGELVVRRQQIPLTPEELLADAERFLEGTRDIAGGLSPSVVLDVAVDRMAALAIKIPTEVHGILNMFDGRRTLVDILEDSPYRVHDTLRVARKGFESKVLRSVPPHKPRPTWRAVVPLEEWLLGAQPMVPRDLRPLPVVAGISDGETIKMEKLELEGSGSVASAASAVYDVTEKNDRNDRNGFGPGDWSGASRKNGAGPARGDIGSLDWADLVPRSSGLEIPMLSPIVPAAKANGEIDVADGDGAAAMLQVAAVRNVIVSEDAIISPEERAEEERQVEARKQAEREAIAKAADAVRAAKAAAAKEAAAKEEAAAEMVAAEAKEAAEAAAKAEASAKEAAAKAAAEKAAAEKAAAEKAAAEKAAAEKAAAEKAAAEKAAAEKAAAEKAAAEKAAAEKAAAEKAAAEKAAAEKAAAEKAAAEKAAADRAAAAQESDERAAAAAAGNPSGQQAAELAAARAEQLADEEDLLENEKTSKIDRRPTSSDVLPKSSKKRDRKKDRGKGNPIVDPAATRSSSENGKADEPSALISDLRAAHSAASTHAKAQAAAASSPDAGGAYDAAVQEVKHDASKATAAFTADEEAFFQAGGHHHATAETFADLDDGYRPRTFWQRLLGRGKPGR
jgi:DNA-binding response OmpR family regulator